MTAANTSTRQTPGERAFRFNAAFARNVVWLTDLEQQVLRNKSVAIVGMGGVDEFHLLTLVRLGMGGSTLPILIASRPRISIVRSAQRWTVSAAQGRSAGRNGARTFSYRDNLCRLRWRRAERGKAVSIMTGRKRLAVRLERLLNVLGSF